MFYTLRIGKRKPINAATLADVSAAYCEIRDNSGFGNSQLPEGVVWRGGEEIGRVSYNGRIWSPGPWQAGDEPIYDNRIAA